MNRIRLWLMEKGLIKGSLASSLAYKVVQVGIHELTSAIVGGRASVCYQPGHWVCAPFWLVSAGYHLTCFGSLEKALKFRNDCLCEEVWLCEARGLITDLPPMMIIYPLRHGDMTLKTYSDWPPGTIMAEGIKLIRRVG